MAPSVNLKKLQGHYAVARLAAAEALPNWADGPGFVSISRTEDELSVVCLADRMPASVKQDGGWTCYQFVGPFAFDETGIVSSVIGPLSDQGLGIFVVSTFDGDHLLLKTATADRAEAALLLAGHRLA